MLNPHGNHIKENEDKNGDFEPKREEKSPVFCSYLSQLNILVPPR